MVWSGFNDQNRMGYKIFLLNGATVYPDTMISRDEVSAYLSMTIMGDSLYAFWREYNPVYDAIRSLVDGSKIAPVTYLFTTFTNYSAEASSPDTNTWLGSMTQPVHLECTLLQRSSTEMLSRSRSGSTGDHVKRFQPHWCSITARTRI